METRKTGLHINLLISIIIIILGLSSCTVRTYTPYAEANSDYLNLLDNQPCWKEICPQVTTWNEAYKILEQSELIDIEQIRQFSNQVDVPFKSERFGESSVTFKLENDIISSLWIDSSEGPHSDKNNQLALKQIIEVYGEPDWVIQEETSIGGGFAGQFSHFAMGYLKTGVTIGVNGLSWAPHEESSPPFDYGILYPNFMVSSISYIGHSISKVEWLGRFPTGICEFELGKTREEVVEMFEGFLFPWPGLGEEVPAYLNIDCRKVFN